MRKFEKLIVTYHSDDIIPYPEYKGKPYFSIQYEENGEHYIGYGTYNPQVLSGYIKDYFNGRASMVEELEKIKAEINKQSLGEWYVGRLDGKSENVTTIESINKIIDNHIAELKGE